MSGPAGEEVGKVTVRVAPNTGRFDDDLKHELKKLKDLEVRVPVEFDVDTAGLRAKLEAIRVPPINVPVEADTARGTANVERFVQQTKARRPSLTVHTDLEQVAFNRMIAQFQKGVKVKAEVDEAALKASLAKVKADMKVKAEVDAAALKASLAEADARMKVKAEFDKAEVERILANLDAKAQIEVDQQHLRDSFRDAIRASHNVGRIKVQVDLDRSLLTKALDGLRNVGETVGRGLSGLFGTATAGADQLAGSIGGVNVSLGSALALVAKVGAGGFLIAEAGAAITAAWGLVSTAIAAVPAAIGLIGAPIATVMLGMDGIKRAAKALEPEFNRLKESVSATFEKGLKPVFDQLKGVMDRLTPSINNVANSLVGLADRTADWITKAGGAASIQNMFNNVAAAIDKINLTPLLDGFTRLAGHKDALNAVVGLVNTLGVEIQKIADNPALAGAFQGLQGVLESLTRAFGDLVNNGIKAFATAAPGAQAALDGISAFFNKFDWARIGTAVGNALKGVGDAFKNIPSATVEAITAAFERLGQVLSGPQVAGAIQTIADSLPGLVDAVSTAIDGLADVIIKIQSVGDLFGALVSGDGARIEAAFNNLFKDTPATVEERLRATGEAIKTGGAGMAAAAGEAGQAVPPAILSPLLPLPGQVGGIASQIPPALSNPLVPLPGLMGQIMGQVPPAVTVPLAPLPSQVGGIAGGIPPAMTGPLSTLPGVIGPIFGGLPALMTAPIEPLPGIFGAQGHRITAGFGSGLQGLSPALQAELGLLPPVAATGVGAVGTAVDTGLAGVATGVPAALAPMTAAFTTGFAAIAAAVPTTFTVPFQTALTTAFTTISAAIPTTFTTPFQAALTVAFQTINAALPTIFTTPFQTALTTAFAAVNAQLPTTFTAPFQAALTTAFAEVNAQLPAIFTTPFQEALTLAFTTIFAAFPTIFTLPFQTAITTGLQAVVAQFPTIFTLPLQTAFTTAFAAVFLQFPTIFTLPFQAAITLSLQTIAGLMPTLFLPINDAFIAAFVAIVALIPTNLDTPMTAAVRLAMTNFNTAVTDGFATVQASVTTGVDAIITELDRLPPAGTTTGNNLITAMASAITAGRSKLINAIAQVIAQAIAAATQMLQINSPSKVFQRIGQSIPEGAGKGVTDNADLFLDPVRDLMKDGTALGRDFRESFTLPDWSTGSLGGLSQRIAAEANVNGGQQGQPVVNVFVGDEQLDSRTDYRIGLYDRGLRGALAVR